MLPANGEKAPINSIDRALANDHSSRPTLSSAAIGRWKMPKLWRAPTPMVRMTAPQITAIQKLRCSGVLPACGVRRDVGEEAGSGFHEERDIGGRPALQISGVGNCYAVDGEAPRSLAATSHSIVRRSD